jgi:hypothetical protein
MKCLLLVLAAFSLLSLPAPAAVKKIAPPPPEVFGKVVAIDLKTNQITLILRKGPTVLDKKPTIYTVDSLTTVTINGAPAKLSDIHAGLFIQGTTERDAHTLDNISLLTKAPTSGT